LSEASSNGLSDLLPFQPKFEMTFFSLGALPLKGAVACSEFGRDDHLVAAPAAGHPPANPFSGLVAPVAVGSVDEIAAGRAVVVEDGEDGGFVDGYERG
jgi:hypothetical protein